jgi:taurine dioxygenase
MEMTSMQESPLAENLPFGTRIKGLNWDILENEDLRRRVKAIFEDRGLIIFEEVEPCDKMLVALSNIIGPLQDLSLEKVSRVDGDTMPGVLRFKNEPGDDNVFEIDGKIVSGWLSWHFDACYTGILSRGGVLRVVDHPPEGGLTGFADGIQLYNAISPALRAKFEDLKILYQTKLMFMNQRFGLPKQFRQIRLQEEAWRLFEEVDKAPRSIHPAIWRRSSGEPVLHVSAFQAAGIEGHEDPTGDALLETLFQEIYAKMTPYWHTWKLTDMVVWDNWRFIHSVSGNDPKYARCVHRTTINGDYGLGALEARH